MLMPDKIDARMLAPCGVNCITCTAYLKKKKPCHGCFAPDCDKRVSCANCVRKNCAEDKGLAWCFECTDFPCKDIKSLDKSYRMRYDIRIIENSEYAKLEGLDAFMTKQRRLFTCPSCGGIFCQHDNLCSECDKNKDSVIKAQSDY